MSVQEKCQFRVYRFVVGVGSSAGKLIYSVSRTPDIISEISGELGESIE